MKKIALIGLLMLSGCGNVPLLNGNSVASSVPGVTANTEKALTVIHITYNGLGASLTSAANSGLLHGADAAKALVYFDKAGDAINIADKAAAAPAANENGVLSAISDAQDAIISAAVFAKGK